jgi:hypothetical protein
MMLDLRVFVLAALLASPVAVLTAQGELTLDEALTRLLVVMVGATAAAYVVRTVWPLLAGPAPDASGADATGVDASGADASGADASGADAFATGPSATAPPGTEELSRPPG